MAEKRSLQCDFCGRRTSHVRRVALDQGYDRLGRRHAVRYACAECSRQKEAQRVRTLDARTKPF
ncbi:MAG: hypothetical protein V3V67_01300 [Myxococcota bacterium]